MGLEIGRFGLLGCPLNKSNAESRVKDERAILLKLGLARNLVREGAKFVIYQKEFA